MRWLLVVVFALGVRPDRGREVRPITVTAPPVPHEGPAGSINNRPFHAPEHKPAEVKPQQRQNFDW